jgi:tetratricopeptide (TPR) repeat protein
LSFRERLLVEGNAAWRAGSYDSAEARLRALVSRYPSDVEGWYQLGEVLFHFNTMRGRPFREAGPPFAKVISLDPAHRAGLTHLARVAAYREDRGLADSLMAAAFRLMPGGPDPELRYFRAVVAGDSEAKAGALAELGSQAGYIVVNAVHRTASYARDLAAADAALQLLIRGIDPSGGRETAANHAYAAGQFRRALEETDALDALLPGRGLGLRAMLAALPGSAYDADVRATVVAGLLARRPTSSDLESVGWSAAHDAALRHWLLGMLAVRSGDWAVALARVDSIARSPSAVPPHDVPRAFAAELRAHVFAARGEHQGALELLTRAAGLSSYWYGWRFGGRHSERWLRAELLERLGRRDQALLVYESLVFGSEHDLILAAPASLRRAAIFAQLGREAEACSAFRTAAAAWQDGDPPALAAIDSARRALRATVRRCLD